MFKRLTSMDLSFPLLKKFYQLSLETEWHDVSTESGGRNPPVLAVLVHSDKFFLPQLSPILFDRVALKKKSGLRLFREM